MQLVVDGPDIPVELFQALEEGRLVLFCGAGVSMRAGLPDFKGLVKRLFREIGSPEPKGVLAWRNLDRLLQGLDDLPASPMRQKVVSILSLPPTGSLDSHVAIIRLSTSQDGTIRLVTTNFDNYFTRVAKQKGIGLPIDVAPKLPVPKPTKWQSLVHLHGYIEAGNSDGLGLILTSADFGTAYVTEAWAGRFMSELFRHYSVLFVGYSIDDPIMRYLVDAIAADRQAQSGVRKAYAFLGYNSKSKEKVEAAFPSSQSVQTIKYHSRHHHRLLHKTLEKWAELYSGRLTAKAELITRLAPTAPAFLAPYEIDQVLWAISDENGYGMKVFAQLQTPPPIEWLDVLEKAGLLAPSLAQQGKIVHHAFDYSLMSPLSNRARWLILWLSRHLGENALLEWVLARGGRLHLAFRELLQDRLRSVNPISQAATQVWQILSDDSILNAPVASLQFFGIVKRIEDEGWTPSTKRALLSALEPELHLSPAVFQKLEKPAPAARVNDLVEGWIKLAGGDQSRYMIDELRKLPTADNILAELTEELTGFLFKAFDLFAAVGTATEGADLSYINRPSIEPTGPNFDFYEWTLLVDLLYYGFQALDKRDPIASRRLVERWRGLSYPIFRRLALAAVRGSNNWTAAEKMEFLLEPL
jgi:SIR2-like domain